MMQCDFCPNEASIEIVIFVNGEAQKVRMCASCYQEKLQEMMGAIPKEWGGKELTDQIRHMIEHAEENGAMYQGVEFNILSKEPTDKEVEEVSTSEDEAERFVQALRRVASRSFWEGHHAHEPRESREPREENKSAREKAFDAQRKNLLAQRHKLTQQMQVALNEENYEKCAQYRDALDRIGDALLQLNEERKDPHGV